MTIILQHQFWDLKVTDDGFEVGLSFGGVPERLGGAVRGDQGLLRSVGAVRPAVRGGRRRPRTSRRRPTPPDKQPRTSCRDTPPAKPRRARAPPASAAAAEPRRRGRSPTTSRRRRRSRPARPLPQEIAAPACARDRSTMAKPRKPQNPHRERHLRPARDPRRPLWGAQTERSLQNFRIGTERMPLAAHPRARPHQARRGRGQPRSRLARCAARRRDRRGGAGHRRRQARRSFPAAGLADRLRHADQHERQRGDRQPRQRHARRQARREKADPSERSRQYEPVVERLGPDRDAHRRRASRSSGISCPR